MTPESELSVEIARDIIDECEVLLSAQAWKFYQRSGRATCISACTPVIAYLRSCEVGFKFPVVKLLDYTQQWSALEASRDLFATVVMA